ncbi:MAG: sigma-70 family RNA polymerase sigma factor [Planctomycetales bacterium]|nr:sigma-70 family RNA polymerase sigma factor [Planctomycetales bacterium]
MDTDDSIRLIESAAAGDTASWAVLLTENVPRLSRFIAIRLDRRVHRRIDADDVTQEIYAEAWRHLPDYWRNPKLPFYVWLRALAQNKLFELHRRHLGTKMRDARREAHDSQCGMAGTTSEALSSLFLDSQTSPSNAAAREELQDQLQEALESMDAIDRDVLVLRHFEQLTPVETAVVLGIEEKAAGMRYVRAIRRLRGILASLPGGLSAFRI